MSPTADSISQFQTPLPFWLSIFALIPSWWTDLFFSFQLLSATVCFLCLPGEGYPLPAASEAGQWPGPEGSSQRSPRSGGLPPTCERSRNKDPVHRRRRIKVQVRLFFSFFPVSYESLMSSFCGVELNSSCCRELGHALNCNSRFLLTVLQFHFFSRNIQLNGYWFIDYWSLLC